jgi:hypothetical protein
VDVYDQDEVGATEGARSGLATLERPSQEETGLPCWIGLVSCGSEELRAAWYRRLPFTLDASWMATHGKPGVWHIHAVASWDSEDRVTSIWRVDPPHLLRVGGVFSFSIEPPDA